MAYGKCTILRGIDLPIEELNGDDLLRLIREADGQRNEMDRQKEYWNDRFVTLLGEMKRRITPEDK